MSDRDRLREDTRTRTSFVDLVAADNVPLRKQGKHHTGPCPFCGRKAPALWVTEDKGFAHCYKCGWSGDVFAYVMQRHRMDFPAALHDLAARAGLVPDAAGRKPPKPRPVVTRASRDDLQAEEQARITTARAIWGQSRKAAGTIVDGYLQSRGLFLPPARWPAPVRFVASAADLRGQHWPAMVSAVQGGDGRARGVHLTFLRADGRGKAPTQPAKITRGLVGGGAIRLTEAGRDLHVAEGIETALSVWLANDCRLATWAGVSLGNMARLDLPPVVRTVHLWIDGDGDQRAMEQNLAHAADHYAASARTVLVHRPPAGQDWNDVLQEGLADAQTER